MEIYNNILNFDKLTSTNTYAFELIGRETPPEFTIIRAINQTFGKGQQGNTWISESGKNLTCSIILYPKHIPPTKQFIISQCISLSIFEVLKKYCKNVSIKWPNDIYIKDKKIAGILIENILQGMHIESCVIGIGLNINQKEFDSFLPNPTSLYIETANEYGIDEILQSILLHFKNLYGSISNDKSRIHEQYTQALYKIGIKSKFRNARGEFIGTISSVDENGKLWILDEDNTLHPYFFKEVEYLI